MTLTTKIIQGHALDVLKMLSAESVDMVMTSPPYMGMRSYKAEPVVWDGDKNCQHVWGSEILQQGHKAGETNPGKEGYTKNADAWSTIKGQFCQLCGAWRGTLGLEPMPELFISHLCDIFDEVKRVLKKTGSCYVNLDDSYAGSGSPGGDFRNKDRGANCLEPYERGNGTKAKSLLAIPERFVLEMMKRGWIYRELVIWKKDSTMPESPDDRFTRDFEFLYHFTLNNKAVWWVNEKTMRMVDKAPKGLKGTEGEDWEWRPCNKCSIPQTGPNTGSNNGEPFIENNPHRMRLTSIPAEDAESMSSLRARYHRLTNAQCPIPDDASCQRHIKYGHCDGKGNVKYSFWSGMDYFFEMQFEAYCEAGIDRMSRLFGGNPEGLDRFWSGAPQGQLEITSLGRHKRAVWTINPEPLPKYLSGHFAAYPTKLCETPILASCPLYVCTKCGMPRVKIYKMNQIMRKDKVAGMDSVPNETFRNYNGERWDTEATFLGYSDCGCGIIKCRICGESISIQGDYYAIQRPRSKTQIYEGLGTGEIPKESREDADCTKHLQENMSDMSEGIYNPQKSSLLQSEVFSPTTNQEGDSSSLGFSGRKQSSMEGRTETCSRILVCPKSYTSSRQQVWLCGRTPSDCGKVFGKILGEMGTGTSQEWNQNGQSNREFRNCESAQSPGENPLSSLPQVVCNQIICPNCHNSDWTFEHAPFFPGVVLDPFAGTGTTLAEAKELGRSSIGIELSERYIAIANRRIERVTSPLMPKG